MVDIHNNLHTFECFNTADLTAKIKRALVVTQYTDEENNNMWKHDKKKSVR